MASAAVKLVAVVACLMTLAAVRPSAVAAAAADQQEKELAGAGEAAAAELIDVRGLITSVCSSKCWSCMRDGAKSCVGFTTVINPTPFVDCFLKHVLITEGCFRKQ